MRYKLIHSRYNFKFTGDQEPKLHDMRLTLKQILRIMSYMDGQPEHPSIPEKRSSPVWQVWIRDIFISLAVSVFIIVFLYQPVKVEGTSMMPGLNDQERIFINKFVYRLEPISRGDVVVFRYPLDPGKSYIKRVIGVAGDRIKIVDGVVFVNGRELREPYVPEQYMDVRSFPETVIPAGFYFVLGDHRNLSNDSRDFGPIPQTLIYGKAVFAYWPVARLGLLR